MKTLEATKPIPDEIRRIGIREFVRNTKTIRKQLANGESFVLCSNGEEIALIQPIENEKKMYTRQDFFDSIFASITDTPGLSNEEIDDIVYGD